MEVLVLEDADARGHRAASAWRSAPSPSSAVFAHAEESEIMLGQPAEELLGLLDGRAGGARGGLSFQSSTTRRTAPASVRQRAGGAIDLGQRAVDLVRALRRALRRRPSARSGRCSRLSSTLTGAAASSTRCDSGSRCSTGCARKRMVPPLGADRRQHAVDDERHVGREDLEHFGLAGVLRGRNRRPRGCAPRACPAAYRSCAASPRALRANRCADRRVRWR